VGGHDSKEDALACLDLMKMKVREDVKKLQTKARIQALHNQSV
jgi:DNA polymerase III epsilon subunit-like protein